MSISWSLHLRRDAASVSLARRVLVRTMETAGVDPEVCYDVSVALSEACANAVEHGGASGAYRVSAYLDGEKCRIEVTDSGPGFPEDGRGPARARPVPSTGPGAATAVEEAEHGRGLLLIRELADHVRFTNRPGPGGAVVSFDKNLKWREEAPLAPV
ncbi:ATP-binding protein [Streptomyces sp. NPDC049906]|uniref:ATP-binding protein n=1 Tax=Streptomyces sp. NPDC049906 TaxID=3155656 RepID=UPI003425EDA3